MKSDNKKQKVVSISAPANMMDFLDLWNLLVQWKTAFISVAITTFLVIVLNFHFNSPTLIYKASAIVIPSNISDSNLKLYTLESHSVFVAFDKALRSRDIRISYFNNNNLIEQFEIYNDFDKEYVFEERFNKMLSVSKHDDYRIVSFEGTDARLAAKWVNGFIEMANEDAVRVLFLPTRITLNYEIKKYKEEINNLKFNLKAMQSDSLFFEGLTVAGIKKNYWTREELELELKNLMFGLEKTETTKPSFSNISAMQFSQKAVAPSKPINRSDVKSIILSAVLSGLVLGILAVFFTDSIARARKRRDSSSHLSV
jgi:LPS O-antigen subunit length determinant protein (WzzB/FepE family)